MLWLYGVSDQHQRYDSYADLQETGDAADFVVAEMQARQDTAVNGNMFGDTPQRTREDVINKIRNDYESTATGKYQAQKTSENSPGNVGFEQNASGRNAGANQSPNDGRGQQDNSGNVGQGQAQQGIEFSRKQPEFALQGQTEAEAQAEDARIRAINRQEAADRADALRKQREEQNRKDTASAVAASRDTFSLTDDMATEEETLGGQGVLFSRKVSVPADQIDAVRKQYEGTNKWMKAPNGKPTKLTERQWLQVRTENFKNWFGDWERYNPIFDSLRNIDFR